MTDNVKPEDRIIEDMILEAARQTVNEYKLAYEMFVDDSASNSSDDFDERHCTIDEFVVEADEIKHHFDDFTKHELDSIIGDMSYVLAFLKRNDRAGKHWKGCTLDVETQAHICKVAYIEVVLTQLEERRMEMTMRWAAKEEKRERLRRKKRMFFHRGVGRLRDLGGRLGPWMQRRRKGVSRHQGRNWEVMLLTSLCQFETAEEYD